MSKKTVLLCVLAVAALLAALCAVGIPRVAVGVRLARFNGSVARIEPPEGCQKLFQKKGFEERSGFVNYMVMVCLAGQCDDADVYRRYRHASVECPGGYFAPEVYKFSGSTWYWVGGTQTIAGTAGRTGVRFETPHENLFDVAKHYLDDAAVPPGAYGTMYYIFFSASD